MTNKPRIILTFLSLLLLSCSNNVTEEHKKELLLDSVKEDPLFNDYITKTFDLGAFLFASFNTGQFNATRLQPDKIRTIDAYIASARNAGLGNADEVAGRVQEALGLLGKVYDKYPDLLKNLSGEEREAFLNAAFSNKAGRAESHARFARYKKTMSCYETFTNAVASVDVITGMQKKVCNTAITDFQISSYGVFRRTLERCNAAL